MRRAIVSGGLVLAFALAAPVVSAQTSRAPAAQAPLAQSLTGAAKDAYASAQILFTNQDFAGALVKYKQSYDLSKDPRLLFNMAICARSLHAYARMQSLLLQYKREAGASISAKDKDDVDAALAAIQNLVGTVKVNVTEAGARVAIDGEPIGMSPLEGPQVLDLGKHTVSAEKAGFDPTGQAITVTGGSAYSIDIALVPHRQIAQLAVTSDDEATVFIDGKVMAKGRFDGALDPGAHQVRVTESGKLPYEAEVDLRDGETRTLQVMLEDEKHNRPIWPWVVGGAVVVAGAAVGGYFLFKQSPSQAAPPDPLGSLQLSAWGR